MSEGSPTPPPLAWSERPAVAEGTRIFYDGTGNVTTAFDAEAKIYKYGPAFRSIAAQ